MTTRLGVQYTPRPHTPPAPPCTLFIYPSALGRKPSPATPQRLASSPCPPNDASPFGRFLLDRYPRLKPSAGVCLPVTSLFPDVDNVRPCPTSFPPHTVAELALPLDKSTFFTSDGCFGHDNLPLLHMAMICVCLLNFVLHRFAPSLSPLAIAQSFFCVLVTLSYNSHHSCLSYQLSHMLFRSEKAYRLNAEYELP